MQVAGNSPQGTGNTIREVAATLPHDAKVQIGQAFASLDAMQNIAAKTQNDKTLKPGYAEAKMEYAKQHDRLQKTTQDFEAVFIGMMLKQMRKSIAGKNELFGNSSEAKTYQDMSDDATAKQMSKVGTFGLARVMFKSMSRTLPPNPDEDETRSR